MALNLLVNVYPGLARTELRSETIVRATWLRIKCKIV